MNRIVIPALRKGAALLACDVPGLVGHQLLVSVPQLSRKAVTSDKCRKRQPQEKA